MSANEAIVVDLAFSFCEVSFGVALNKFFDISFKHVSDFILLFDEKVAAKGVAVMFDNDIVIAFVSE